MRTGITRLSIGLAVALACVWFALPGLVGEVTVMTGPVRVVDGDSLKLKGEDLRLLNIDAPEGGQRCTDAAGRGYDCGAEATRMLTRLIAGRPVTCRGDSRDRYGRLLAHCSAAGIDLGGAMVKAGLAFAYRSYGDEYLDHEFDAAKAGRGIWAGGFVLPWEHRAALRAGAGPETAKAPPSPDCPIKGNISRSGARIYHAPGSRDYAATRISTANGERWFCTEAEAEAEGWRAPRR